MLQCGNHASSQLIGASGDMMHRSGSKGAHVMILRTSFRCTTAIAALVLGQMLFADAAFAADDATDTSSIIVTGSRIRRDPLTLDAPVTFVDRTTIDRTGLSSIADVLQQLPSAAGGLNGKNNTSGNLGNPPDGGGVGAGSAEIDLRYLGARRTLVLLDSLRFVPGSAASGIPASVDLNSIPAGMIERVEILQAGGSSVYGSDAIGGVVNIVTKEHQDGLQMSGQYGTFRQGDGQTVDLNASYGMSGPSTEFIIGGSYVKQDPVSSADRDISQFPTPGATACDSTCSSATPNGRFLGVAGGNYTLKAPVAGKPLFDPEDPTGPNSDFKNFTNADRFNFRPYNYIWTPSERYGGFVVLKQELGDKVTLHVKAIYNHRESANQAAPLPLFVGPDAGNGNRLDTVTIDASNPYNPFGTLSSGVNPGDPPANYNFIGRRLVENGPRHYEQSVDTMYLTGGLDGSFEVGSRKFYWDVNAVLGYNDATQVFTGNVNAVNVQRALGPVADCTGDCVPLNLFGGEGSITPAMLNYIAFTEHDRSHQQLNSYTANLTGDLFELPAGPVGIAIGFEHRDQSGSFDPDPVIQAGNGADIPAQASSGGFHVNEVYGELRVPLIKDKPFFHSLDATGSVRYSDYSTFGGTTTFSGGATWAPVEDFLLRATYAEGFRAPSIGELFGTPSRFDQELNDPCSNYAALPAGTVKTNCAALGIPATYVAAGAQIGVTTGGNTDLQPETSRTWVFGGVFAPASVRNSGYASLFNIEVNYYDINVDNAISSIGAAVQLDRCVNTLDALSCAAVQRTASGAIARIDGQLTNIGSVANQSIDVAVNYRTPSTGYGYFGVYFAGTFLLKYSEQTPASAGFTTIAYDGTERGSPDQAYPKFKGNATFDWLMGDFGASFTGRYISGVTEIQNGNEFGSRFYGDIQMTYTPSKYGKRFGMTLGVNNLFNTQPPGCFSCSTNNFDPTTYDVPGQFGYIKLSYKM
jgi:iron complex outermembrane recepter protein